MSGTIDKLASYAVGLHFQDLPPRIVRQAMQSILDSVGCMVGGSRMTPSQVVLKTLGGLTTAIGECTVVGTPWRAPLPWAVYANAYFSNALDFDDTHELIGHPGATIVPPAISLAEDLNASGRDLLTAVVAGYEISVRIGMATKPSPEQGALVIGFSTWQIFGAATVAAKLLGLNTNQFAHALAIAATNASVPFVRKSGRKERPYAWVKNNYGWASMGGLVAAQLAAQGFRGNLTILDGDNGFWRMAGSDQCDWAAFTDGLGSRYVIEEVAFKPYPACRHTHSTIDAITELMTQERLTPSTVREITVESDSQLIQDFMVDVPDDIIDAQFSVPYVAAMAVLGKTPGYDWLNTANLTDDEVLSVASRVRGVSGTEFRSSDGVGRRVRVALTTAGGQQHVVSVDVPSGDPEAPLSDDALATKFEVLTSPILGHEKSQALRAQINALENAHNSDWIPTLLSVEDGATGPQQSH
ncbi:MAG: MmgE/PrpD family protein [Anaerolineae bacterium]